MRSAMLSLDSRYSKKRNKEVKLILYAISQSLYNINNEEGFNLCS